MKHDTKFNGLLDIPEGSSGKFKVEHFTFPAGHRLETANMRTAMMGGQKSITLTWPHETKWHRLTEGGGVWMSDLPIEVAQHLVALAELKGKRVLIGGLGIGLTLAILAARETPPTITVVEKSADVIKLVGPHIRGKAKIVHSCLHKFLKATNERYDAAFYDIWQSDGEHTFFETVVPLLAESDKTVKRRPLCWNEDVMRGQLIHTIQCRLMAMRNANIKGLPDNLKMLAMPLDELCEPKGRDLYWNWTVPFFRGIREGRMTPDQASTYASIYGLPGTKDIWSL